MTISTTMLTHNKVQLALHLLRDAAPGSSVRSLLLLHGLGEHSPSEAPDWAKGWQGPVHALDFTGHGASTIPAGGGYSAETLMADADIALEHLGEVTLVGRGLGAYIALMLAGARAAAVRGTLLCDGPGLAGGPVAPTSQYFVVLPRTSSPPDPYVMFEMSHDLRPPDYATLFARLALEDSGLDEPLAVAGMVRPPWLAAVVEEVGLDKSTIEAALEVFATH